MALESGGSGGVVWRIRADSTRLICAVGSRNGTEETKLLVLDFDEHVKGPFSSVESGDNSSSSSGGTSDSDNNNFDLSRSEFSAVPPALLFQDSSMASGEEADEDEEEEEEEEES